MFGSHLSIAGGLTNALDSAELLKLDCVQIFTKNQRQWKTKPLTDQVCDQWKNRLGEMGWNNGDGTHPTVSHNSYLINMASPDKVSREKSIALQRVEIENCTLLGVPFLVSHPGAHLGAARKPGEPNVLDGEFTKDEIAGLKRIVKSLDQIHADLPGYPTIICIETTVGSGTNLGYDFGHMGFIREHVKEPDRIGFCLDTCHVTAAGYDMTTDKKAEAVLEQFDEACGLAEIKVLHLNDSIGAVGSRKDRHAHIGEGTCGLSCFRSIVNHPVFSDVPKILETPKEQREDGVEFDLINVRKLKRLIRKPHSNR